MFIPYELTIRNFMSFGNNETKIRLDFSNPTLIVGRNHDSAVDGQVDSNGAGKTTILNAINYVLYDSIISDKSINADDLINNINKKNMYVSLVFTTGDDVFYKVERYRKNKDCGGNGVRVFERTGGTWSDDFGPEHDVTPDSIANANVKIVSVMGMAFEVFSRIVAFSATHKPFLFLPASEQTEIVEDITGLSELSVKAENLKKKSKTDKQELDRLTEINNTIKAQRSQILTQIESARAKAAAWEQNNCKLIEDAERELKTLSGIDFDEQLEYFEYIQKVDAQIEGHQADKREIAAESARHADTIKKASAWQENHDYRVNAANVALSKFESHDYDAIRGQFATLAETKTLLRDARSNLATKQSEKAIHDKVVADKRAELTHLRDATCPYCSQQFKDAAGKIVTVETQMELAQQKADKVQVEIDSIELDIAMHDSAVKKLTEGLVFASEAEMGLYQRKHEAAKITLDLASGEINPYSNVNVAELEQSIEECNDDITKLDRMIVKKQKARETAASELKYANMKVLTADKSKVDGLKETLNRLCGETNPLSSVVTELEAIKLEDTKDDEIAALEDLIEHQQFLVKLLTKKDSFVRKTLLQKSIPFLNTRLRYYLDRIGFLHRVAFQEDLSVQISQFGNNIGFGNLSSGQKARINLALSFSFRDMLQARHGKLKFCILDECLDVGLGNVGVQLAAKMIKSVATDEKLSMFIISHRDEIANMFDNKLVVELRSGFSSIADE